VPETGFSGGVMRTVFPCTDSGAGGDGRAGGGVGSGVGVDVGVDADVGVVVGVGASGGVGADVGAGVGGDVFGGGDTDVEGGGADRVVTSGMAVGAEVAVDDGLGADVSLVPETDFSAGVLPRASLRTESDAGGDVGVGVGVGVAVGLRAKVSARATTLATAGSEGALFDVPEEVAAAGGSKFTGGARSSGV
jgi:hypothetical protein